MSTSVEKRGREMSAQAAAAIESTEGTRDRRVAKAFGLEGESWMKHANPASVWTRFSVLLPAGAGDLEPRVDRRLVPGPDRRRRSPGCSSTRCCSRRPKSTRNWASRSVLGERIWVDRDKVELPEQFRSPAASWIANGYSIIGLGAARLRSRRPQPARDLDRPADHPRGQGLVPRPHRAAVRRDEGPQRRVRGAGTTERSVALLAGQRERVEPGAAVDADLLAGDVAGVLGGEVGDQRGDLARSRRSGPRA